MNLKKYESNLILNDCFKYSWMVIWKRQCIVTLNSWSLSSRSSSSFTKVPSGPGKFVIHLRFRFVKDRRIFSWAIILGSQLVEVTFELANSFDFTTFLLSIRLCNDTLSNLKSFFIVTRDCLGITEWSTSYNISKYTNICRGASCQHSFIRNRIQKIHVLLQIRTFFVCFFFVHD